MQSLQKRIRVVICLVSLLILLPEAMPAQKVGFISSKMVRNKFSEAKQADQRIQSIVEEWNRELEDMQKQIEDLEFEIKKNRLIWSDEERFEKEKELKQLIGDRRSYAQAKFEPSGEYDIIVKQLMTPVEVKIYAAVQKVASDEGYDLILDQSIQPIPYTNYKYDLTVKVLRELGVDVDEMEKELQKKIAKDPRNKKKKSKRPGKRRRRSRNDPDKKIEERKIEERKIEERRNDIIEPQDAPPMDVAPPEKKANPE